MTPTFPTAAFAEATEYERYILDTQAPAIPEPTGKHILDLRTGKLHQHAHVTPGVITARAYIGGEPTKLDLTPLVFGAAWKVVDVLVETQLVAYEGGGPHSIKKKVSRAKTGNGVRLEPPFTEDVWRRILRTYANTFDLRHSVTHRQFTAHSNGTLEASPEPGQSTPPTAMTEAELSYFFRAIQETYTALITQSLPGSRASNLRFLLDQLRSHHRMPPLAGREITGYTVVQVRGEQDADGIATFDMDRVLAETSVRHPNARCDLEIHVDDGRIIRGDLEDWPTGRNSIDPDRPHSSFTLI
ncbi:hypothetical protein ACNF49_14205 [Actinomadura sp. ATCC 39365]